jgi:hypothetical protein
MFLMTLDGDLKLFVLFLLLGTSWWFIIGRSGWSSQNRMIGRVSSAMAAILGFGVASAAASMCADTFLHDIREGALTGAVSLQYLLIGLLCIGALASGISSAKAALTKRNRNLATHSFWCRTVALWFFIFGMFVAIAWLGYWSIDISESHRPIAIDYAAWISFPVILLPWPGFPKEGMSGRTVMVFFALVTVANGVLYAVIAMALRQLRQLYRSRRCSPL